jgi:hypothetical protein
MAPRTKSNLRVGSVLCHVCEMQVMIETAGPWRINKEESKELEEEEEELEEEYSAGRLLGGGDEGVDGGNCTVGGEDGQVVGEVMEWGRRMRVSGLRYDEEIDGASFRLSALNHRHGSTTSIDRVPFVDLHCSFHTLDTSLSFHSRWF